jgi:hypothetical protein
VNRSIIIGAFIISAAILLNGVLERRAHVGSTASALVEPVAAPGHTIAVLPFENLSRDPDSAYFADGIRREIIARLTTLHVKAASVQEAPRAGEFLLGSVRRAGNRVHPRN